MYGYGLIGLLILVLDIYVIMRIVSGGGDPGMKLLWIILVLLLPLIGPILYFLFGSGGARV
jgi:Phospholipase_D-nuclease N-terminal